MLHYERLQTCDDRLIRLFTALSISTAFIIICGERTPEEQMQAYQKGRIEVNGVWTVNDKSKIVTNCDGYIKKSPHNFQPSHAVDVMPDPLNYEDKIGTQNFAQKVLALATKMQIPIKWGGNFKSIGDTDHYELIL
jgi:peptidoglycan LD-endopeptidase CwlK